MNSFVIFNSNDNLAIISSLKRTRILKYAYQTLHCRSKKTCIFTIFHLLNHAAFSYTGFIQARPSKIQGLFKDFSRTNLTIFKDLGWML